MNELHRFLRHVFGPFVVWAVANGYLPEWAQKDVIEALVICAGFVVPYVWSWIMDKMGWRR